MKQKCGGFKNNQVHEPAPVWNQITKNNCQKENIPLAITKKSVYAVYKAEFSLVVIRALIAVAAA